MHGEVLSALIYIRRPDGKLASYNGAWGYCDGRNLYIRSISNYFRLQRSENPFYVFGSKEIARKKANNSLIYISVDDAFTGRSSSFGNPMQESSTEGFFLKLRPFELDWDDGELR